MQIREEIRKFLERFISGKEFEDDDNIFEKGLVNSLFAMQLIAFIEENYDIELENEDLELSNFKDVNSIVNIIESKLN